MEKRKSGFYWVKESVHDEWSIAQYLGNDFLGGWIVTGTGRPYSDKCFYKINENRIMSPDERE